MSKNDNRFIEAFVKATENITKEVEKFARSKTAEKTINETLRLGDTVLQYGIEALEYLLDDDPLKGTEKVTWRNIAGQTVRTYSPYAKVIQDTELKLLRLAEEYQASSSLNDRTTYVKSIEVISQRLRSFAKAKKVKVLNAQGRRAYEEYAVPPLERLLQKVDGRLNDDLDEIATDKIRSRKGPKKTIGRVKRM